MDIKIQMNPIGDPCGPKSKSILQGISMDRDKPKPTSYLASSNLFAVDSDTKGVVLAVSFEPLTRIIAMNKICKIMLSLTHKIVSNYI